VAFLTVETPAGTWRITRKSSTREWVLRRGREEDSAYYSEDQEDAVLVLVDLLVHDDPLRQISRFLSQRRAPPFEWVVAQGASGDPVRAAWDRSIDLRSLFAVGATFDPAGAAQGAASMSHLAHTKLPRALQGIANWALDRTAAAHAGGGKQALVLLTRKHWTWDELVIAWSDLADRFRRHVRPVTMDLLGSGA